MTQIIVWRLDRWGRSLADLVVTLKELSDVGASGFDFVGVTVAKTGIGGTEVVAITRRARP